MNMKWKLRAGDWIEVRSKDEILETLDHEGRLDGMPFMPEMFAFCGRRFRVIKRAHKTCDTVFPIRGRKLSNTIHLETRCDGQAHGGCQASCLIFWKEAWLKPVDGGEAHGDATETRTVEKGNAPGKCSEDNVFRAAKSQQEGSASDPIYVCQATQLPYASSKLSPWDFRQYIQDYTSGNVGLGRIFQGAIYSSYYNVSQVGIGLGPSMRWLYEKTRRLWDGPAWPRKSGMIPMGQPTPVSSLNLMPGELVRVKSHEEILSTINVDSRNRGMAWDAELVPYCGGTYRVHKRVTKIVDERTGKMQEMKTPCIILEGVVCQARYSNCRMFCPRAIYPYWREIWLERVSESSRALDPAEAERSLA